MHNHRLAELQNWPIETESFVKLLAVTQHKIMVWGERGHSKVWIEHSQGVTNVSAQQQTHMFKAAAQRDGKVIKNYKILYLHPKHRATQCQHDISA